MRFILTYWCCVLSLWYISLSALSCIDSKPNPKTGDTTIVSPGYQPHTVCLNGVEYYEWPGSHGELGYTPRYYNIGMGQFTLKSCDLSKINTCP